MFSIKVAPVPPSELPDGTEIVSAWHGHALVVAYRSDASPLSVLGAIATALGTDESVTRNAAEAGLKK